MDKEPIDLWRNHKWTILLAAGGLFFAVLTIQYSFIKAIFIFLCIGIGLVIGRYLDKKTDFSKKFEDFFKNE
jgi:uncharacterized membrane protein